MFLLPAADIFFALATALIITASDTLRSLAK